MTPGSTSREARLVEAFVGLADSLVADFDIVELLGRLASYCVDLLDVSAAGLLLADQHGDLRVIAASAERTRLLELFQLQNKEGPCSDCFRTGAPVVVEDIATMRDRWPRFAPLTEAAGFRSVHALPMRLRSDVIGTLNIFRSNRGRLSPSDAEVGQALAAVATISILQSRAMTRAEDLAEQLQAALHSRVVIEQAKGVLAERGEIDVDEAFRCLRSFARSGNHRLGAVASAVVSGTLDLDAVLRR
jgi:GAF domain-containing protein